MKALLLLLLALPARAGYLAAPVDVVKSTPIVVLQGTNPWTVTATTITFIFASTQPVNVVNLDTTTVSLFRQGQLIGNSSFTVYQGSAPWEVVFPTTQTVVALQGTTPWIISPTTFSIQNVSGGTISVNVVNQPSVSGSTILVQNVAGTSLSVTQGSNPWFVTGGTFSIVGTTLPVAQFGAWNVTATIANSTLNVVFAGSQPVVVTSLPLPAGAATEATLATLFKQGQFIGNSTFTVTQGSAPWSVSGSTVFAVALGTVPVQVLNFPPVIGVSPQPGSTWTVVASSLDIRGLTFGRDKVDVSGSNIGISLSSIQVANVVGTSLAVTGAITNTSFLALASGTYNVNLASVTVYQGTNPWNVTGGTFSIVGTTLPVSQAGAWSASQAGGSYTVTPGTGTWNIGLSSITAFQGGTWNVQTTTVVVAFVSTQPVNVNNIITVVVGSSVSVSGSTVTAFQGGVWNVNVASTTVYQGTNPWMVTGGTFSLAGVATVSPQPSSTWSVTGSTVHVVNPGSGILKVGLFEADGSSITATAFPGANALDVNLADYPVGQSTMAASMPVAIAVDQSTFPVRAIPMRPSSQVGRVYISSSSSNLTGNQIFYTVTSGKTLFVTSFQLSGQNTNNGTLGNLEVKDNTVAQSTLLIPTAGSGLLTAIVQGAAITPSFQEPLRFITNIRVNIVTGAVTYSFAFQGYEE